MDSNKYKYTTWVAVARRRRRRRDQLCIVCWAVDGSNAAWPLDAVTLLIASLLAVAWSIPIVSFLKADSLLRIFSFRLRPLDLSFEDSGFARRRWLWGLPSHGEDWVWGIGHTGFNPWRCGARGTGGGIGLSGVWERWAVDGRDILADFGYLLRCCRSDKQARLPLAQACERNTDRVLYRIRRLRLDHRKVQINIVYSQVSWFVPMLLIVQTCQLFVKRLQNLQLVDCL